MDSVLNCMVSDQIEAGIAVREFETLVTQYIGSQGALAFSSYYVTLIMALHTLELQPGDAVVISALAPSLYQDVLSELRLVPVILDVNVDSGLVEPAEIEKALPLNPKAILYHYTLGYVPAITELLKFNIPVIEDISQCLGTSINAKMAGAFGDLAILSLKPHDIITTAEGGIILFNDKKYLQKLKQVKARVLENLLMPDFNASLGIAQMKLIATFIEKRKTLNEAYTQSLMKSRYKSLLQHEECEKTPYSFPVIISSGLKEVQKYSRKKNIDTIQAFLNSVIAVDEAVQGSCKNAKTLLMCTLLFPLYPMLGKEHIDNIIKVIGTIP